MKVDNLNKVINALVSLRNDLETMDQEGCGCTPNGLTCEICLAEARVKEQYHSGFESLVIAFDEALAEINEHIIINGIGKPPKMGVLNV